jgi:hypothetical protein
MDLDLAQGLRRGDQVIKPRDQTQRRSFFERFHVSGHAPRIRSFKGPNCTLKTGRGQHRKYLPYVFTEQGAIMAANVLNSAQQSSSLLQSQPNASKVAAWKRNSYLALLPTFLLRSSPMPLCA